MEGFKSFTPLTTKGTRSYGFCLSASYKGHISLSRELSELMELNEGDKIEFIQNERHKSDWFIRKNEDGFPVRKTNGNTYKLNSSVLAREIIKSVYGTVKKNSIKVEVAKEPTPINNRSYYSLLTSKLLKA